MDTLKILIVDDESGIRSGVERILSESILEFDNTENTIGFDVILSSTGLEAIDMAKDNSPDIILLDYKLPDLNGLDVINELNHIGNKSMVIMMTAYASLEVAISATKGGSYDFIPKPFTPEELRNTLKKAAKHILLLKKAERLEDEKKKIRFEFVSVLAHELKSPINAVDGYLDILKRKSEFASDKSSLNMLSRCNSRIHGMRKLINDLLDLTHIESGEKKRSLAEIDLITLANNSIELLMETAREANINITLYHEGDMKIYADGDEFEIIFNNLISNAIKYNRKDGTVTISLEHDDHELRISVTDSGIGIAEDDIHKLFSDFVRIKNNQTANISGSGLGLSTVKKIAQLYSGDVSVSSKCNSGSTFMVNVPNESLQKII